jgi:hypothetical protein
MGVNLNQEHFRGNCKIIQNGFDRLSLTMASVCKYTVTLLAAAKRFGVAGSLLKGQSTAFCNYISIYRKS